MKKKPPKLSPPPTTIKRPPGNPNLKKGEYAPWLREKYPQKIKPPPRPAGNPNLIKGQPNPYSSVEKLKQNLARGRFLPRPLTVKQRKYVKAVVIDNLSKREALRVAGYDPAMKSSTIESSPIVRNALTEALHKIGVTPEAIAAKLKKGMHANETKFFSHEGIVTDQRIVPDYGVQEKFTRDILEISGYIRNNFLDTLNIGLISVPPINGKSENWNEPDVIPSITNQEKPVIISTPLVEQSAPSEATANITKIIP